MSELSVEKLNNFKKLKCYTNKKIAKLTGISLVTIDNIFSGKNKNPTVGYLKKIARVLDCAMDDLFDYDSDSVMANYYIDKETNKLAQEIYENPNYRVLLDASRTLEPEQLKAVINIVNAIKGTNNG